MIKGKLRYLGISVLVFLALLAFWVFYLGDLYDSMLLTRQGDEIVAKIESFRKERGRLPDSLEEIGLQETESGFGPWYEKKDELNYEVFFSRGFDYSKVYDSNSKKWEDIYQ